MPKTRDVAIFVLTDRQNWEGFFVFVFLVSAHSACACKNFGLKCFPELQTLHYITLFFSFFLLSV